MKTQINPASKSKINITAAIMAVIGALVTLDIIPPELEKSVTQITLTLGPVLIGVFRTWFTKP